MLVTRHTIPLATLLALSSCLALEPDTDPLLIVVPGWVTLEPGDSTGLALARVSGDTLPETAVGWSSSNPAVAAVDQAGVVSGKAMGVAVIRTRAAATHSPAATVVVAPPVLVGAGDIAACGSAGTGATAALLDGIPGVVFTTGDNAYPSGTLLDYQRCYDPTWGRHRMRTRPTPGGHDYLDHGTALGYFRYFGANAGDSGVGYYSYDVGAWHVVAINNSVPFGPGSAQETWLRQDLAAHPALCTVAYGYLPRFSSGRWGSNVGLQSLWQVLEEAGVDVAVAGHDHLYERFALQRADGTIDTVGGIRQFVVGTGGGDLVGPPGDIAANSQRVIGKTFGVLKLTLWPGSYGWQFLRAPGGAVLDSGTTACH